VEHSRELDALATKRNVLESEIEELRASRDQIAEEHSSLSQKNAELAEANAQAEKKLEATREMLAQVQRSQSNHRKMLSRGHRQLPSTDSPSPVTSSIDITPDSSSGLIQAQKAQPAPPAVKKFKWGKQKAPSIDSRHHPSASKSGLSGLSGRSFDLTSRQHIFQATSILRPVRCEHCGDKMWGLQELRCGGEF
jgi:small-conductance mechanosensitive channel